MSGRKAPKPIYAFHRFLEGIYSYYLDKGMSQKSAKLRMFKETYNTAFDFFKKEKDYPDHVLVTAMQSASRHLNHRGAEISKKIKDNPNIENKEQLLQALHQIKETKDSIDNFITVYRGETDV